MNLKMLIYCTKAKDKFDYLRKLENGKYCLGRDKGESLNGKIVAECDFEVEEIKFKMKHTAEKSWTVYLTPSLSLYELKERSCLNNAMLDNYKPKYAIHIKSLKDFENPYELDCFYRYDSGELKPLKRAPQNMCYAFDIWGIWGNKYVVISVHPNWLCLILNGRKDVEVRRKILKEMKE